MTGLDFFQGTHTGAANGELKKAKIENNRMVTQINKLEADLAKERDRAVNKPAASGADIAKAERQQKELELLKTRNATYKEDAAAKGAQIAELDKQIKKLTSDLNGAKKALGTSADVATKLEAAEKELAELKTASGSTEKSLKDVTQLYQDERRLRRLYYNKIEEMKGNVRVYCRARPLSSSEKARGNYVCIKSEDEFSIEIQQTKQDKVKKDLFQFDRVYTEVNTQDEVYEDTGNLIQSVSGPN